MVYQQKISIDTKEKHHLISITEEIRGVINNSQVESGIVNIGSLHTTGIIFINENEEGLLSDYKSLIKITKKLEEEINGFKHNKIDDNAASHLLSGLIGNSKTIPIKDGTLILGTWQNIFFFELDGAREKREIFITIIGE